MYSLASCQVDGSASPYVRWRSRHPTKHGAWHNALISGLDFLKNAVSYLTRLRADFADRSWNLILMPQYIKSRTQVSETLSTARIAPGALYSLAMTRLAATGIEAHWRFLEDARAYRRELVSLTSKTGDSARVLFDIESGVAWNEIPVFRERSVSSLGSRVVGDDYLWLSFINILCFALAILLLARYDSVRAIK